MYIPERLIRNRYNRTVLKILVQEVPKTKRVKSRETDRMWDVRGIVRRAGECRPLRQSSGTQYSKRPAGSLTQPSGSGNAYTSRGSPSAGLVSTSHTRIVASEDPDMMWRPSGE